VAVIAPNTPQPIGAPFDVKINVTGDVGYKAYQYHLAFNFGGLNGDPPVIQAGPPVLDYVSNKDNGVLAQCTESPAGFPMGKQQSVFVGCGQLDLSTGDQSAFGDIATVTLVCAKDGTTKLHLVVGGEGTAVATKLITSRAHVEITTVDDTVTCGKGGDAQTAITPTAQTASPGSTTPGRTVSAASATATHGGGASADTSTESGGLNSWAVIAIAAVAGAAVLAILATVYVRRRARR